jgi:hypothetical protein
MSTYAAQLVMGKYFSEVGLVAGFLMKVFHNEWPLAMFLTEFTIFGATTFFFAKSKSTFKMIKWRWPIAYLPALTVLTLVANNSALVLLFATVL